MHFRLPVLARLLALVSSIEFKPSSSHKVDKFAFFLPYFLPPVRADLYIPLDRKMGTLR